MIGFIFQFYKELLSINVTISICLAVLTHDGFGIYGFPFSFMSAGYLLSLAYFEVTKSNQYYFYFNKSLSRLYLFLSACFINAVLGLVMTLILYLCTMY